MNNMNNVAFGAGKTGAPFDPVLFLSRPQVILRIVCWLCAVIVWSCISMNGWYKKGRKEICLFNNDNAACRFGSTIGFIGLILATGFLALEAFFQNLSSIKVRRRAVLGDVGLSGVWSVLFLFVFGYLAIAWGKSEYPYLGQGINNCRAAIVFSFFSIASWGACAYFAYLRWQEGADLTQFTSGFDPSAFNNQSGMQTDNYASYTADGGGYTAYTSAAEADPNYSSNPFMAAQETMGGNYQAPSY